MSSDVTDLNAFVPLEVRRAAQEAYRARLRYLEAQRRMGAAMRGLRDACKAHNVDPADILVGKTVGTALVPAAHRPDLEPR